ncbi:MAG TPA: hypothetical protein VGL24_03895 [Chthoniobacterales bacterium]|jgi:hypothetical protein
MKTKIALSMLLAVALLPACTTTKTASTTVDDKSARYASNVAEPAPPAEGPEADIPSEGPANPETNPAYIPTPLLRSSAASSP